MANKLTTVKCTCMHFSNVGLQNTSIITSRHLVAYYCSDIVKRIREEQEYCLIFAVLL